MPTPRRRSCTSSRARCSRITLTLTLTLVLTLTLTLRLSPDPNPKPSPDPNPDPNPNPYPSQTVKSKTGELLQLSSRLGVPPSLVLPLAAAPTDAEPIGTQFAAWAEARKAWP